MHLGGDVESYFISSSHHEPVLYVTELFFKMLSQRILFILNAGALLGFPAQTAAQSTSDAVFILDPTDCVAEPVTMSYCTSFMDKLDNCFYTSEAAAIASCFCPQSVLNYLAG